jgi:hypothetical protein
VENVRLLGLDLRVMHRHGDEWVRLERSPGHDPAESDPERGWGKGTIFRCPSCAEEVLVVPEDERLPNG